MANFQLPTFGALNNFKNPNVNITPRTPVTLPQGSTATQVTGNGGLNDALFRNNPAVNILRQSGTNGLNRVVAQGNPDNPAQPSTLITSQQLTGNGLNLAVFDRAPNQSIAQIAPKGTNQILTSGSPGSQYFQSGQSNLFVGGPLPPNATQTNALNGFA